MALNSDLKVASAEIVVEAERMPAEMIENLPVDFVSVETTSEQTEKAIAGASDAVAAEQEKVASADVVVS